MEVKLESIKVSSRGCNVVCDLHFTQCPCNRNTPEGNFTWLEVLWAKLIHSSCKKARARIGENVRILFVLGF